MLAEWNLSNFKSVASEVRLPLSPVTIIAGTNSSGKSTIIQSILLLTQTMQSRFKQKQLLTNGEFVRLGTPSQIFHLGQADNGVVIGGVLDFRYWYPYPELAHEFISGAKRKRSSFVGFNLQFSTHNESVFVLDAALFWRTNRLDNAQSQITLVRDGSDPIYAYRLREWMPENLFSGQFEIRSRQFVPVFYRFDRKISSEFLDEISVLAGNISTLEIRDDPVEAEYNRSLSHETFTFLQHIAQVLRAKSVHEKYIDMISRAATVEDVLSVARELKASDQTVLKEFIQSLQSDLDRRKLVESVGEKTRLVTRRMPIEIKHGIDDLEVYFENQVHYLGPLRDDPRVIYAIPSNTEFKHVGLKGEYTAAMLNLYGNDIVDYPLPSTDPEAVRPIVEQGTLTEAIGIWLRHMGLADSVDVNELTNIGYELNVHQSDMPQNLALTSVGVGVSQVLPTLVMCLLVSAPCTLLIEQPELHLHPRVQSILGDFFLGLTYCGKQCIVETHSEHIINRLFVRIAQDGLEQDGPTELLERIGILFVEKDGTASTFRSVKPNEFGVIPDNEWPSGFLDQSMLEAQRKLAAAKQKRQRRRGG